MLLHEVSKNYYYFTQTIFQTLSITCIENNILTFTIFVENATRCHILHHRIQTQFSNSSFRWTNWIKIKAGLNDPKICPSAISKAHITFFFRILIPWKFCFVQYSSEFIFWKSREEPFHFEIHFFLESGIEEKNLLEDLFERYYHGGNALSLCLNTVSIIFYFYRVRYFKVIIMFY